MGTLPHSLHSRESSLHASVSCVGSSQAAQRELERQRKEEWERRRQGELKIKKEQEQDEIGRLKAKKKSLELELEAVVSFYGGYLVPVQHFSRMQNEYCGSAVFTSVCPADSVKHP